MTYTYDPSKSHVQNQLDEAEANSNSAPVCECGHRLKEHWYPMESPGSEYCVNGCICEAYKPLCSCGHKADDHAPWYAQQYSLSPGKCSNCDCETYKFK